VTLPLFLTIFMKILAARSTVLMPASRSARQDCAHASLLQSARQSGRIVLAPVREASAQ
jgi:hypothetical protein